MKLRIGKLVVSLTDVMFYLIALLGFFTLFFTINYNETILRIMSYTFFLVGYILYFSSFNNGVNKFNVLSIIYFVFIIFIWAFSGFKYNILVSCLSFFLIFSSFESTKSVKSSGKTIDYIYFFYFAQASLLILFSFSKYSHMSLAANNLISNDLLLGLTNPNETGMALAYTIMGLFICIKKNSKRIIKLLTYVIIFYLFYLLILTRARTSFVGLVVFFVLSILYEKKKGILFTNKFLYLLFIIYPVLFVPIYTFLSLSYANRVALFGKTLFSGRQEVYIEHYLLWSNKLIGNITLFNLDNAHNGFFTILINFGIIGLLLYIFHLIFNLFELKEFKCSNSISRAGFIAILCIFFMSATESAFIVSGKFYFSNFLIMLWLANYSEEERTIEKI